jgi:AhpC/TSA family/EF hand
MKTIGICCGGAVLFLGTSLAPATAGEATGPGERPGSPKVTSALERFDKNKDGSLDRSEVPDGMARRFKQTDLDGDGKLSARELERAAGGPGRRRPGGPATRPATRPGDRPGEVITPAAAGERHPDTLKAGDPAPDFTLPDTTGTKEVTLSGFRGKRPVVLIFASYT